MGIDWKIVKKLSYKTLPISIAIFAFFTILMSFFAGGLASAAGFPIPFYYDVWRTPEVELNSPPIILLDILIIYLPITFLAYLLKKY